MKFNVFFAVKETVISKVSILMLGTMKEDNKKGMEGEISKLLSSWIRLT